MSADSQQTFLTGLTARWRDQINQISSGSAVSVTGNDDALASALKDFYHDSREDVGGRDSETRKFCSLCFEVWREKIEVKNEAAVVYQTRSH